MSLLIETIRVYNGSFNNVAGHEARMRRSLAEIFSYYGPIHLAEALNDIELPAQGLYKCRVVYSEKSMNTELIPYTVQPVRTLRIVVDNEISYDHKFLDRAAIENNYEKRGTCDDILIIRNGLVTDTSYANIAFKTKDQWITPASFILAGTQRQFLISSGKLEEAEVTVNDLKKFTEFKLINSMLLFDSNGSATQNIIF
jgi:4-amino-4-deoxychorismate lyase